MNWGHSHEVRGEKGLLYYILESLVSNSLELSSIAPIDRHLKHVINGSGFFNSDVCWEIDRIQTFGEPNRYHISSDQNYHDGDLPDKAIFNEKEFKQALKETLLAYAEAYPEKVTDAFDLIRQFNL
jgi:hypothetical protein